MSAKKKHIVNGKLDFSNAKSRQSLKFVDFKKKNAPDEQNELTRNTSTQTQYRLV